MISELIKPPSSVVFRSDFRVITNGLKPKAGDLIKTTWGAVGKVLSVNEDGSLTATDSKGSQARVEIGDVAKILPPQKASSKDPWFLGEVS
jgi:preprotein translocase subunit YajC